MMMRTQVSILLIDDDDVANFLNERVLRLEDVASEIVTAQHGREALQLLDSRNEDQTSWPQLIFLDIKMPVMGGFEFLTTYQEKWRELQPETRVVMLTSSLNQRDVDRAREIGADQFLDKPLTSAKVNAIWTEFFGQN